jgi:ABC-type multidrug transport system fused ATPase/permease subunit
MKALKGVFKYVWPQWPRIVAVTLCAIAIAVLLSLSFLTVIPLLKVMVEEQGLHGWLDTTSCRYRYGVTTRWPTADEVGQGQFRPNELVVTSVDPNSLADRAGLRAFDRITSIGPGSEPQSRPFSELLAVLATTSEPKLTLQVQRGGATEPQRTRVLSTPFDRDAVNGLYGWRAALQWKVKLALIDKAQWAAHSIPRERSQQNMIKAVAMILVATLVVTAVRCAAKYSQAYLAEKIVHVATMRLKQDVFAHLMQMPVGYFARERPSDCVSRVIRDANEMNYALKIIFGPALREPLNTLFLVTGALVINCRLTLIFLTGAPLVLVLVGRFGKKMRRASHKSLQAGSRMLAKLEETLAGLRVVKVYNRQSYEHDLFSQITQDHLHQQLKMSRIDSAISPVLEVIGMATASVALVVGAYAVTQQQVGSSEFLGLLVLLGAAADAARKSSDLWPKLQRAAAPAERISALLAEPIEVEKPTAVPLSNGQGRIEFRGIRFTYPGTERPVLRGINLTIEAGQTVAIVGPNGSGKTTLVNLIPRFYDPDQGQVLIDGVDICDVTLASLRDQMGLVTQNTVTFNDTISRNIAYGKPGATEEEVITAAHQAFAHEFVEQLPSSYQTVIGEHGAGLSGGQLQRIIIARAILKNPAILIFDEATSQVDADSEAKIHRAIETMMTNRTTLIIAHRFSTVMSADKIVVMHEGQIIDEGCHDHLVSTCPLYRSLYETQLLHR